MGNEVANRREQGIRTSEKTSWEEQSKSSEVAVTSTVKFPPCIFRPERRCNNLPRRKICQLVARETASAMHASRHLLVGRCYNFVLFADGVVVVSRSETRNLRTVLCDEFIRESNKNSTYKSLFHFYYRRKNRKAFRIIAPMLRKLLLYSHHSIFNIVVYFIYLIIYYTYCYRTYFWWLMQMAHCSVFAYFISNTSVSWR